jgi:hypothetical protein
MNPLNGIKIKAFKNANTTKNTDKELQYLKRYLTSIADLEDVTTIKHKVSHEFSVILTSKRSGEILLIHSLKINSFSEVEARCPGKKRQNTV